MPSSDAVAVMLVVLVLMADTSLAFICNKHAYVCETSLEITSSLTMFHETEKAVFPKQGKLYRYDVTNTTDATPININEVITADGWERQRVVIVANGTLPGPSITVYEDQVLVIHVRNRLYSDTVSIHWHGLPLKDSPYMDGVSFVTQCPINPGQTFTYRFRASPKGTYWYHSHVGTQRAKGLYGALVILDRDPPPIMEGVTQQFVMQVQDWNHDYDVDQAFLYSEAGVFLNRKEIKPSLALDGSKFSLWYAESSLINGKGRYHNPESGTHNEAPLEVFEVKQNQTYMFRLINAAAMYPYRVSIDDHPLTVIASDGYYVTPVEVESVIVHPGERFDFLIRANKSLGNYMIRGHTLEVNRRTIAEAVLHYEGADQGYQNISSTREQCFPSNKCFVLNCPFTFYPNDQNIQCITIDSLKSDAPGRVPESQPNNFREYFLNFAFPGPGFAPDSINGVEFTFPTVSAISQPTEITNQCQKANCSEQNVCSCTHSIDLNNNDTVQFVFLNMGRGRGWSHPVHMHGHSFHVVKMGYGNYNSTTGEFISHNPDIDCRGGVLKEASLCNNATWSDTAWSNGNAPGLNLLDPPRKDTIIVPSGGYVVVRIKADNPGLWLLHCHIQLHSADGMSVLLNESFSRLPAVPEGFPKCGNFGGGVHSKTRHRSSSQPPMSTKTKTAVEEIKSGRANGCRDDVDFCSEIKNVCTNPRLTDIRDAGCRAFCRLCTDHRRHLPQHFKRILQKHFNGVPSKHFNGAPQGVPTLGRCDPYLVPWLQKIWN